MALSELKEAEDEDSYRKAKTVVKVLAATGLPGDPALKYLACLGNAEAFKDNEYVPLIECLFAQGGEVEDEDE